MPALAYVDELNEAGSSSAVVQQLVDGSREAVSVFYAHGNVWASFAQVSHRTMPVLGGVSVVRESIAMPVELESAALALVRGGYKPPAATWQEGAQTTQIKVLGEQFLAGAKLAIHMMLRGGYASEHDAHVGRKLANILAGGALSSPQMVSEQYVLDLEREAFVSLCGEKKTQERIAHTLKTGKPLRN